VIRSDVAYYGSRLGHHQDAGLMVNGRDVAGNLAFDTDTVGEKYVPNDPGALGNQAL
jgi:hypothetical protein